MLSADWGFQTGTKPLLSFSKLSICSRKQGGGSTAGKDAGAPPSGPEDSGHSPIRFMPPEIPDGTGISEPLWLSGIVTTARASTSAYVTKDDLAAAMASLEGKIVGILDSMEQDGKKWEHFPSPDHPPVVEEEFVNIEKELARVELEEGQIVDSTSEDSEPKEVQELSQAWRVIV